MKLRILISGIALLAIIQTSAQSIIGMTKEEVHVVVKERNKKLSQDKAIVKQQFNYLKFVNRAETITYIVYFSENDIATSTKMVCDYAEYDFVLDDLNEKYEKKGKKKWQYSDEKDTYTVELIDEEWYFSVRERKKVKGKSLFRKQ